ncbi:hypothetical protein SAMN05444008_11551 [Cnuella takakiae]|uniref:Uncharacterized protein n=1 Tax=Cnuella takakiae TaxID=1302690 RepID=A0A1M5G0W0_9BACT|nr:hypothetical protein [Cnuella takakiae]OLY92285.1 hypothetical protein BUE76_10565 [Cnuella takakiae]SHF97284.1 hypothetical protein SAMN05444008_11551 [Cnuella takakiae]
MKMYLVFLIAFFYQFNHALCQTTIIAKRTTDAIYVAVDSKTQLVSIGRKGDEVHIDTVNICKAWHNGKVGFALAGRYLFESKKVALQLSHLTDPVELYNAHAPLFGRMLLDSLKKIKEGNPEYFNLQFGKDTGEVASIIAFGFQGDSLCMVQSTFNIVYNEKGELDIEVKPIIEDYGVYAAGYYDHIEEDLISPEFWRKRKRIDQGLKELINREAKYHPMHVGGPINIIKVQNGTIEWITKNDVCIE